MGIRLSGTGKNWAVLLEGRLALLSRVFSFLFSSMESAEVKGSIGLRMTGVIGGEDGYSN